MVALALTERQGGMLAKLLAMIKTVHRLRLKIIRGALRPGPGSAAYEHREAVLDLCLPLYSAEGGGEWEGRLLRRQRRLTYKRLYNGDIANPDAIEYYADETETDAEIRKMFHKHAAKVLVPNLLKMFPRHRWTGSSPIIRDTTLLFSTHCIAVAVLPEWAGWTRTTNGKATSADDILVSEDECDGQAQDAMVHVHEALPEAGPAQKKDYAAMHKVLKGDVRRFALSNPRDRLVVMAMCSQGISKMMRSLLHEASSSWEKENAAHAAAGRPKKYRITEAVRGVQDTKLAEFTIQLLTDPERWLALSGQTLKMRSLAYRLLVRACAACLVLITIPCRGHVMFLVLHGEHPVVKLCMVDDFSQEHMEEYADDGIECDASLAVLEYIASTVRLDMSNIEVRHGHFQREVRKKSATWTQEFCVTSGVFCLRRVAGLCQGVEEGMAAKDETLRSVKSKRKAEALSQKEQEKKLKKVRKRRTSKELSGPKLKKVRSAAWSLFVSKEATGDCRSKKKRFQGLSQRYKVLKGDHNKWAAHSLQADALKHAHDTLGTPVSLKSGGPAAAVFRDNQGQGGSQDELRLALRTSTLEATLKRAWHTEMHVSKVVRQEREAMNDRLVAWQAARIGSITLPSVAVSLGAVCTPVAARASVFADLRIPVTDFVDRLGKNSYTMTRMPSDLVRFQHKGSENAFFIANAAKAWQNRSLPIKHAECRQLGAVPASPANKSVCRAAGCILFFANLSWAHPPKSRSSCC